MDPPSRQEIADTLHETIHTYIATNVHDEQTKKKYKNTAERIRKHPPNKNFSLTLLGNFQPDHEYFKKDYQKPKNYKQAALVYEIDNSNGFFDNLPTCKPSKKNSMQLGMNKELKNRKKLEAMEMALQHLQQRITAQRDSMGIWGMDSHV